jgi:hypothetical protein
MHTLYISGLSGFIQADIKNLSLAQKNQYPSTSLKYIKQNIIRGFIVKSKTRQNDENDLGFILKIIIIVLTHILDQYLRHFLQYQLRLITNTTEQD